MLQALEPHCFSAPAAAQAAAPRRAWRPEVLEWGCLSSAASPGNSKVGPPHCTDGASLTQFRWDYVMESGIRALPVALALRLPGDYLPLRGLRGINQHAELAVVEQEQRAEQPTADRDRFSFKVREPCGEGQWSGGRP